ncbi:hypothetical protein [Streptomyces sp. URMC 129]|uniref:hypothetical protein n=1 Tax=Streptomyces sp. URMC 129 TaxID=3423407 RepID=UPI003F19A3D9
MTDEEPPRTSGPRRRLSRRALDWTLFAAALALVAGAGFAVGRTTAPGDSTTCADVQDVYTENYEAGSRLLDSLEDNDGWHISEEEDADRADARTRFSTAFNVVIQNPDCFSVEDRATAQTHLDQLSP